MKDFATFSDFDLFSIMEKVKKHLFYVSKLGFSNFEGNAWKIINLSSKLKFIVFQGFDYVVIVHNDYYIDKIGRIKRVCYDNYDEYFYPNQEN